MRSKMRNVDRLSSLPEEVVSHILSLMPTKLAVRTSILSKRWRYSWTLVRNLDFDDSHPFHGLACFSKFVDRVLELCKTSQVILFRLRCSEIWVPESRVSKWISDAVRLNVRDLDIQVILTELPLSLFTCKTLTTLRLVQNYSNWEIWNFPSSINLPCLKTLDMDVFSKPSLNAFKLIRGCPVLESFSLYVLYPDEDEEYNFNISTLKRLKLTMVKHVLDFSKVVLHSPNVEYLFVSGGYPGSTIDVPSISPLTKLLNLKHLELMCRSGIWNILESSSKLEHLCIEEPTESWWIEPQSVPTCMLTTLKTMKVANWKGLKCGIRFMEFMLGNAEVLKTVTVTCSSWLRREEELRLCAQLLKLPRASRYCEIHFVGNWPRFTSS